MKFDVYYTKYYVFVTYIFEYNYFFCSTTTTLSQGINLPAHTVIIKSTQIYRRDKGYIEYDRATMLQMIGRGK